MNCCHGDTQCTDEPCVSCYNAGTDVYESYTPGRTDNCDNCKHEEKPRDEDPCNSCAVCEETGTPDKWEPRDKAREERLAAVKKRVFEAMDECAAEAPRRDLIDFLAELNVRTAELLSERGWE